MINIILIAHVFVGLIGVGASYAVVLALLKRNLDVRFALWASITACVAYILSYCFGAYYYDVAYTTGIEAMIRASERPWIDLFFMETKGRIFLFLPFLSGAIAASIAGYHAVFPEHPKLKRALIFAALAAFLIGVFVSASGILISSAA